MLEGYEDYFETPSDAEQIIQKATGDLKELLTDAAKSVMEEAAAAKRELESLQSKIREKEYKLRTIEEQIAEEKQRAEKAEKFDIPRKYINHFVTDATGGFAPGDTVWVIEDNGEWNKCSLCRGERKIRALIGEAEYDVRCPKCDGSGRVRISNFIVVERKISSIYLKLRFSGRVEYWDTENIFLEGQESCTPLRFIYKTREEAEKALAEKVAVQGE